MTREEAKQELQTKIQELASESFEALQEYLIDLYLLSIDNK